MKAFIAHLIEANDKHKIWILDLQSTSRLKSIIIIEAYTNDQALH